MTLDREAVAAVDSSGQLAEVLDLPIHLRDAVWRVESSAAVPVDAAGGVIVAGMGGSAIGGRLALGALGQRLARPLLVWDGYGLPGWAGQSTLVLCSSYSGRTEETLSAYDEAALRGAARIVSTTGGPLAERARRDRVPVIPIPGGFQPRAAVGYSLVAALEAARLAGAAPSLHAEIEAAATLADALAVEWGPDGGDEGLAKALARSLHGTIPLLVGSDLAAPVTYRWKTQFNENADVPAFAAPLPEADHNEVVGWAALPDLGRFTCVFLDDEPDAHPRNVRRAKLTAQLAEEAGLTVLRVPARGETPLERLVSLVLLGDLVTLYVAVLRGADPGEVAVLDRLKAQLSDG